LHVVHLATSADSKELRDRHRNCLHDRHRYR